VVNFVLAIIELFHQLSQLRRYERILVEIIVFERGEANFWRNGVAHCDGAFTSVKAGFYFHRDALHQFTL